MTGGPFACQPVARLADDRHAVGVTGKDKEREERLAAALRENLKRRKAQAREAAAAKEDKQEG
jgi:hypothetical protein